MPMIFADFRLNSFFLNRGVVVKICVVFVEEDIFVQHLKFFRVLEVIVPMMIAGVRVHLYPQRSWRCKDQ